MSKKLKGLGLAVVTCVLLSAVICAPAQAEVDAIDDLKEMVEELELPHGIETSLLAKLESALASLDRGRDNAANQLEAFIHQVEAQSGKKLTEVEADALIETVQEIIDDGTGPSGPWSCGDPIEDLDGNTYNTVLIGDQCWMAENLDYDNGCSSVTWVANSDEGWCGYYNGTDYGEGLLYQWSTAMNGATNEKSQGLCPSGWHIPTLAEWSILIATVDSPPYPALVSGGTSGFEALLAGNVYSDFDPFEPAILFKHRGIITDFWTSTSIDGRHARIVNLYRADYPVVILWLWGDHSNGKSVRCLQD